MLDAGVLLEIIRIEHRISRYDLSEKLGTSVETLKEIEDNNGTVPDEWLRILYRNCGLSPEELYMLDYLSEANTPFVVTHTYKGYTAVARGGHSLSIRNSEGIEVLHTGSREKNMNISEMEAAIDSYLKLLSVIA